MRVANMDLAKHAHWVRTHITEAELKAAQLPRVIDGNGRRPAVKPDSCMHAPICCSAPWSLERFQLGSRSKAFPWLLKTQPHYGGHPA